MYVEEGHFRQRNTRDVKACVMVRKQTWLGWRGHEEVAAEVGDEAGE